MRSREKRARCPSSSPPFHENEEAEEKHRACELDKHANQMFGPATHLDQGRAPIPARSSTPPREIRSAGPRVTPGSNTEERERALSGHSQSRSGERLDPEAHRLRPLGQATAGLQRLNGCGWAAVFCSEKTNKQTKHREPGDRPASRPA